MKFFGKNRLDFGGSPDHDLDTESNPDPEIRKSLGGGLWSESVCSYDWS